MASPVIRYTFDSNGTNSGTGGTSYNLTIPTAKQPYIGVYNGALKIFTDPAGSTSSTVDYQAYFSSWTMPSAGCTISMWLKIPEYVGQGQAIFEATPSVTSNGSTFAVVFWVNGGIGGNTMLLYWNNTIRGISLPAPGTPGNYYDNNWHHFVFTIDSSSMISVYIDKVFIGSVNTVSLVNTTFTKFVVGGRTNPDPPLHGYVDEFRIYNSYVATSSQVTDLYKESYENFFDYGTITSLNTKRVNIRDIYDNNLSTLTDEDPAILVDKDNIKVEFFVGLTTNEYLPYRTETIWYYQSGDWLYQQGNGARGFVASNSEFPCIGSIISGPGSIENESDCKPGWLAFHPEYFSGDEDSLKLYIKLTPVFGQVIKKYIIYYHENQQGGGIRFATGQNYGTGSHVQHNSQLVLSNQATSGSWKQVNSYGGYTSNVLKYEYTFITPLTFNASDSLYIHISDAGDFTNFFAVMQVILEVETLEVLFDGDNLTITNSINSTDTDTVIFELPGDYKMTNLTVTEFTGTGTIAYTLSKDGANIVTGTITSSGVNLLTGNTLKPGSNTLYTLTLTANAAINYTIVGTKVILDTIPPTMTITSSLNALDVLKQLNTIFSGYTYNNFSNISGTLNSYGCRIIATPKNGALAELLVGSTNINDWGFFNQTEFDSSSTMPLTYGFANDNALNSLPYMVGALFTNTGYVGLFVMAFKDYNSNTKVKDLFYPVLPTGQARTIYTYILNRNNTSSTYSSGNTKWNFSNGQGAGVNGYYSSSALSIDDGVWGFAIDKTVDANGGGSLGDAGSISYGIENWNTSDGNVGYYWGGSTPISTSNYGIVMFTGSTITIPVVTNGSTSNKSSIPLIFTSSESTTNFTSSDVTVSNGSLSNFTGSGSVYTATFTPSGQGACTISVAANKFTDAEGNNNTASNTFNWTFDSTPPTMTITSLTSGVTNGSTTNNASIILIFTFSESTADFTAGDVTLSNCTLSNFAGGLAYYSATITPSGQGLCTISVAANKYTDAVGNKNTASSTFNWTYDSVSPTMTITSTTSGVTSGSTTNNASIALTFTSTESTSNFTVGDVSVSNGLLSSFAGSGSVYTATFTPSGQGTCTISVIAGKYTDAAGNNNTASNTFTWTYDSVSPSMTITSTTSGVTSGSTTNNASIALTFTSSESTSNFTVGDVSVSNGSLSSFAGSGSIYTATFTPSGQGACTISVIAGKYTDTAGNNNSASNTFNWTYDSVSPSMTITSTTSGVTSGSTTNNASIALTFTSSESTTNFIVGDVAVTNGTLSSFAGSGSVYTATFTPSGQGACTISVIAGKYTDTAGNNNTASNTFTWTYDSISPSMTITSSTPGVTNGSRTNNTSIDLTFTSTESTSNFTVGDITVSNGTLSNFAGSGSVYTATFTPSGQGLCTIDVAAGVYTDIATNLNNLATQFAWTFDSISPSMTITSSTSGVTHGSTTNNASIALTFTSSESTTNLISSDVTVSNGSLSNFAGSGSVYTATFTPSGQGTCTISVGANTYTDVAGNYNTASNTFTWTYDSISPSMTITSSTPGVTSGSSTNNASIALTFTSSESTTNFTAGDVTVSNGTLSNFTGSGTLYTATFTPSSQGACTISIIAGKYTDLAGNNNTASNIFTWTFDNVQPTMTITSSTSGVTSGSITNNTSIELTITSNKVTTNFEQADITVINGSLSNFAGSGTVYTATFTPSGQGLCTISVGANTYTDAVGNNNTASNTFNWTYDSVSPTMTITSTTSGVTSGSTTNNASIALTFTSSESTSNFTVGDVSVSNGSLSSFAGSGSEYTATFTPSGQGACTINVDAGKYTDAAGNNNTASNTFNWIFDSVSPSMTITSTTSGVTSGSTTNNASIALTFTSSETTTNFEQTDIIVTNGALSNFAGSGSVYTATFTPSGQGGCTISVGANTYTDVAGNNNTASNTFTWTFDNVPPTMTITSTTSGVTNGSTTNNTSISLFLTSTKITTNFTVDDITVTNGTLSDFRDGPRRPRGRDFLVTFTPADQGLCTINVDAGTFTDAVGNPNTFANTFNWTFDSISPSMTITSTTLGITSGSTTNDASIALTFTSTESTINFTKEDVTITNGTLSNFAGSGKVYTATFTPSGQGLCTIDVAAGVYTDEATNLNNLATQFTWTFDSIPPIIAITSTNFGVINGTTTNNASISFTFTSTKSITNFEQTDIIVTNGTLSGFTGSDKVYSAIFTPTEQGLCTIDIGANKYTDTIGNNNIASTTFSFTFDTIHPNMTITANTFGVTNGSATNNPFIELTFTSSEVTADFEQTDITVTNGIISGFTGSGTVYIATFTPTSPGLCTIDVAEGAFIDAAGNTNTAATTFTWTFDDFPPSMTITSTTSGVISGSTSADATIALTFTSTKSTSSFEKTDIIVTNGTISGFSGSGTVYTATFTPTKFGECTIGVPEGAFIDDAGNNNIAVTTFIWTFGRAVSFDTNSITIFNSISANDIDIVLFVLLSGEDFPSLDVTDFTGDGTITYEISSDGETVNSGSFSEPGINLFGNKPLSVTTDTTYVLKMVANASLTYTIFGIKKINYGSVIPTALSFINNALTIQNSIDSNDVDKVSFSVNAYDRLHILQVTNLLNPTAVNYVLEILDGPIVISGRFFQEGYDLLQTNILSHSKNTTYILTLTSDSVNNYSIICGTIGPPDRDKLCTQKKSAGSGIKSMGTCNNVQYKRIVTSTNTPSGSSKIRYSQILRSRRFKYVRTYIQSTPPVAEEIPQPMFTYGKINTHSII